MEAARRAGEGIGAGEPENRAKDGEEFARDQPVRDEGVHGGEKKDPEWSGVAGDDVAVEGEAAACGKATGELEMDVGVVLPVDLRGRTSRRTRGERG